MIDLSNNENTLIKHDFKSIMNDYDLMCKYPCDSEYLLKEELAKKHNVKSNNISLGCGSSDIIYRTICALNARAKSENKELNLIVPMPTFDLVLSIAKALKIKITYIYLKDDFILNVNDIKPLSNSYNLIYITNPNNPSAKELSQNDLEYLCSICKDNTYMILDEAYAEYNANFISIKKCQKNIIITRTFSKIYALAGLRIGYAIAENELLSFIDEFILIDNINAYALFCAINALKDEGFESRARAMTLENKAKLEQVLNELDIFYFKSNTNFILYKIKSENYYNFMLENGVKVGRKIHNYPLFNRISVGNIEELNVFFKALKLAKENDLV